MDAAIKVEAPKVKSAPIDSVARGIVDILRAGAQTNVDQATIQKALDVFQSAAKLDGNHVAITGSSFQGDYTDKRKK